MKRSVHPLQSWSELEVQDGEKVPPRCLEVDLMDKTDRDLGIHTHNDISVLSHSSSVL